MARHLISTQQIELDVPSKELAMEIQDRISFLYSYRWTELIEACLDEALEGDQYILIEEAVLDLGDMSLEEWEDEMPKRLQKALREYLKQLWTNYGSTELQRNRIVSKQTSYYELLKQSLKHGYLTAWQKWPEGSNFEEIWQQVMESHPLEMITFLRQSEQKHQLSLRLAHQLSKDQLISFLDHLAPHSSSRIQQYLVELRRHPFIQGMGLHIHSLIWASLIEFLSNRTSGTFASDLFLHHLLQRLAEFNQSSFEEYLQQFHEDLPSDTWQATQWGKDLTSLMEGQEAKKSEEVALIWIQQFLENGFVPQQAQLGLAEIRKLYHDLFDSYSGKLMQILKSLSVSDRLVHRLLMIVQEKDRVDFINFFVPHYTHFLLELIPQLASTLSETEFSRGYIPEAVYQDRIWHILFQILLRSPHQAISLNSLLRQMVDEIEDHFGLEGLLALDIHTHFDGTDIVDSIQESWILWTDHRESPPVNAHGLILEQLSAWLETGILPSGTPHHHLYIRSLIAHSLIHHPKEFRRLLHKHHLSLPVIQRFSMVLNHSLRKKYLLMLFPNYGEQFRRIYQDFLGLSKHIPHLPSRDYDSAVWVGLIQAGLSKPNLSLSTVLPSLLRRLGHQFDFPPALPLIQAFIKQRKIPNMFRHFPINDIQILIRDAWQQNLFEWETWIPKSEKQEHLQNIQWLLSSSLSITVDDPIIEEILSQEKSPLDSALPSSPYLLFLYVLREGRLPHGSDHLSQKQLHLSMQQIWHENQAQFRKILETWKEGIDWEKIQVFFPEELLDEVRKLVSQSDFFPHSPSTASSSPLLLFLTLIQSGYLPAFARSMSQYQVHQTIRNLWEKEKQLISFVLSHWPQKIRWTEIGLYFPSELLKQAKKIKAVSQIKEGNFPPSIYLFLYLIETGDLPSFARSMSRDQLRKGLEEAWNKESNLLWRWISSRSRRPNMERFEDILPPILLSQIKGIASTESFAASENMDFPPMKADTMPASIERSIHVHQESMGAFLHVWTYELRHAHTPWWNRLPEDMSVLTHLPDLLRLYPDQLVPLLQQLGNEDVIRSRILRLLQSQDLEWLLPKLSIGESFVWTQWIEDLLFLHRQQAFTSLAEQKLKDTLLRSITQALLRPAPSVLSTRKILKLSLTALPLLPEASIHNILQALTDINSGSSFVYQTSLQSWDQDEDLWEKLEQLFERGAKDDSPSNSSQILETLLQRAPKELVIRLRTFLRNQHYSASFFSVLSPSIVRQLVQLLSPQYGLTIWEQATDLQSILSKIAFQHQNTRLIEQKIWAQALLSAALESSSQRQMIYQIISDLARVEGMSSKSLTDSIIQVQNRGNVTIHSQLLSHLHSLSVSSSEGSNSPIYPSMLSEKNPEEETNPKDLIYVTNAGLVLLSPYLGMYLQRLGLTNTKGFVDHSAQLRSTHLLQYLVNGQSNAMEFELSLNKILCGLAISDPIPATIELSSEELEMSQSLLQAICQAWPSMSNSSSEALQESFLQRAGQLHLSGRGWELQVEKAPYDLLMQTIPWSYTTIKLSFMKQPLYVEWG